jgi:hypothetical protein
MDPETIEMARAGYTTISHYYETGDEGPVRRHIAEFFDPACVLSAGPEVFVEGEWSGHDGMIRFMTNQREVFQNMWIEPLEFIDTGGEWLLVPIRFGGRARHTGVEIELTPVHAFRIPGFRVTDFQIFQTLEDARAGIAAQPRLTDS